MILPTTSTRLFVGDSGTNLIYELNPTTGAQLNSFGIVNVAGPSGLAGSPIPEPAGIVLLLIAIAALALLRK